jgi:hypothetical protein
VSAAKEQERRRALAEGAWGIVDTLTDDPEINGLGFDQGLYEERGQAAILAAINAACEPLERENERLRAQMRALKNMLADAGLLLHTVNWQPLPGMRLLLQAPEWMEARNRWLERMPALAATKEEGR